MVFCMTSVAVFPQIRENIRFTFFKIFGIIGKMNDYALLPELSKIGGQFPCCMSLRGAWPKAMRRGNPRPSMRSIVSALRPTIIVPLNDPLQTQRKPGPFRDLVYGLFQRQPVLFQGRPDGYRQNGGKYDGDHRIEGGGGQLGHHGQGSSLQGQPLQQHAAVKAGLA